MSRTDQDVFRNTRIPQPIRTVQTALVTPRLRMPNENFCKQLTPSRAIFESKKLKTACSFLRQLKEKLQTDDSTTEFEREDVAIADVISTLHDVNDAITPILSSASTASFPTERESEFLAKEFDEAMNAASKIYEVTKRIRQEAASDDDSMCYFSKQIIASNYEQFDAFKENLNTIGDRVYVDRELVKQLVDLQVLLKDTIRKLKEKEEQLKSESESLKPSRSGRSVKLDPSLEQGLQTQMTGSSMLSGDTGLSSEISSTKRGLEEIKAKPEKKAYFVKCIEHLDLLKARLQAGDACAEVKLYKDKKSRPFDELRLNVDGTPLLIQTPRTFAISGSSTEEAKDKKEKLKDTPAPDYRGRPLSSRTSKYPEEAKGKKEKLTDTPALVKPAPDYRGSPRSSTTSKDPEEAKDKKGKLKDTPALVKPAPDYRGRPRSSRMRKDPVDLKEKHTSYESPKASADQKLKPTPEKERPDKPEEKPKLEQTYIPVKKETLIPDKPKEKAPLDKPKYKKEKHPSYISKLTCCKRKRVLKQIPERGSRPDIPYTAEKGSLPTMVDEEVCPSRELDVKRQKSTLRKLGINHPDANVTSTLKQIPVDYLLMSCRPAKCCRNTVLNEKPRAKFPYAASLRSLPLVQKDLDKIKELVQSKKSASDKLLYFCNAPASVEVRFFEIFRREFSKTSLAKPSKTKTTQSGYEIRILDFLRRFYSREPAAPPQETQKRSKKRKKTHAQRTRSKTKKKRGKLKAMLTPQFSLSSTSFIGSRFTIRSKEEKSKPNYSFLLVPKTKVTSYISEEITTYKHEQKHEDESEHTTTTSNFSEHVKTGLDSQAALDVSSLSPENYAETLTDIYELDEEGNIRAKSKSRPHKFEVATQHHEELPQKPRSHLHEDQIQSESDPDEITPPATSGSRKASQNVGRLSKYKASATNVIGPEVTGSLAVRSGPEKILKVTEPNLCTIYEVEESKRSEAGDETYQQRCDMCQKLMVQNFSDESIVSYSHRSRTSASDSGNSLQATAKNRRLVNSGSNTPGLCNPSENATLLQMNLDEVIHKLNYRNIYRVNTSQTQTVGRCGDIPSGPVFETTALSQTKQISVQTSRSDMLGSEMPIHLFPSRIISSRETRVLSDSLVEMKHKQTESIIHQVKLNLVKKKSPAHLQIEKNVLSYVIHPKKMKARKEQAESKYFASAVKASPRTSTAKGFKRTSFQNVSNLKRANRNVESKCEMVCSWPPKRPQPVYGTPRKAFFVSVHGSDGELGHQKQDNLPRNSSTEETNNSQRSDAPQKKNGTQTKTERTRRSKRQPAPSYSNQNYIVGFVGSDGGEGEKKAPKCGHHRHRKEKLKRKKFKRVPEVIDVTMSKHVKRSVLEYRAINDQNVPGFVTVLSTPCDCPDVTIFIPCFCGNYKCDDKCKVSRLTRKKTADYAVVPLTNQGSVYSVSIK